eukprot:5621331-Amphidinium_carterae.1
MVLQVWGQPRKSDIIHPKTSLDANYSYFLVLTSPSQLLFRVSCSQLHTTEYTEKTSGEKGLMSSNSVETEQCMRRHNVHRERK